MLEKKENRERLRSGRKQFNHLHANANHAEHVIVSTPRAMVDPIDVAPKYAKAWIRFI